MSNSVQTRRLVDSNRRFEHLYSLHRAAVVAYFRRRLAYPDDALDAAAEVFAVVWRRLDGVPDGAELPWIYGVCRRVLLNTRRSARRRESLVAKASSIVARPAEDPAGEALARSELVLVLAAVDQLPSRDRELLRLVAWEQMTPAELAVVLGCSAHAARQRLYRARRRLERRLGRSGQRDDETDEGTT